MTTNTKSERPMFRVTFSRINPNTQVVRATGERGAFDVVCSPEDLLEFDPLCGGTTDPNGGCTSVFQQFGPIDCGIKVCVERGRSPETSIGSERGPSGPVDELADGEGVKLSSFGSFGIRQKGERVGRNPKTGEEVPITPRRVLVFRPSNIMKDRINKGHVKG